MLTLYSCHRIYTHFHNFQMSIFNKQEQKLNEKLLRVPDFVHSLPVLSVSVYVSMHASMCVMQVLPFVFSWSELPVVTVGLVLCLWCRNMGAAYLWIPHSAYVHTFKTFHYYYTTLYFWHPRAENPAMQTPEPWLSCFLLLWIPQLEFTPTRP